jgi:hypothetical protein
MVPLPLYEPFESSIGHLIQSRCHVYFASENANVRDNICCIRKFKQETRCQACATRLATGLQQGSHLYCVFVLP